VEPAGSVPDISGQSGIPALPFQRSGAGFIDRGGAVLLGQGENAEDASHSDLALGAVDGIAECTDERSGAARSPQQLGCAQRRALGVVFFL
jgi:hypothetical protein